MLRSANSAGRSLRRVFQLTAILALAVAGCGSGVGDNDAAPAKAAPASTTNASSTTEADRSASAGTDWCPSADEVAEVLGHEVTQAATGGFTQFDELMYAYDGCAYRDIDTDTNTDYSITRVTLESEDVGSAFELLAEDAQGSVVDNGFTPVEDLGDDAYLDGQSLVFRTGDTMVFLEVKAEGDEDVTDRRDTLAEELATIDLSDDEVLCTTPVAAVEGAFGPVSDANIGGGGTFIDDGSIDISINTLSCTFDTDGGTEVTVSVADAGSWHDWVAAKRSSDFSAFYEALLIGEYAAFDTGEELIVDDSDEPLRIETWTPEISGEDAMALRVALAELVLAG